MNGGLIKSCELVARVRSGRVVKAGSNGIVLYNAEWLQKHRDTKLRWRGEWERYDTSMYVCSSCGKVMPEETGFCPNCGANMSKEEREE